MDLSGDVGIETESCRVDQSNPLHPQYMVHHFTWIVKGITLQYCNGNIHVSAREPHINTTTTKPDVPPPSSIPEFLLEHMFHLSDIYRRT